MRRLLDQKNSKHQMNLFAPRRACSPGVPARVSPACICRSKERVLYTIHNPFLGEHGSL